MVVDVESLAVGRRVENSACQIQSPLRLEKGPKVGDLEREWSGNNDIEE